MFTIEDALNACKRYEKSIKMIVAFIADEVGRKKPNIHFDNGHSAYYNSWDNEIVIGIHVPLDVMEIEDEESYINFIFFLVYHELMHYLCTASKPYIEAIERGTQLVIEYIQRTVEPRRRIFKKESDYRYFLNEVLPKEFGYTLPYDILQSYIRNLANEVEDGRIERIGSYKFPEFKKRVRQIRGYVWMDNDMEYDSPEDIEKWPKKKMLLYEEQMLSLAVTQLYSKGFTAAYAGTDIYKEVSENIMPKVGRIILSNKSRDMGKHFVELIRELAPLIFEAMREMTTDELTEMANHMQMNLGENLSEMNNSEKDEMQGSGAPNSLFGNTDIELVLSDETFDQMKEDGLIGKDKTGTMVRREHPLPEGEESEEKPNMSLEEKLSGKGKGSDGDETEGDCLSAGDSEHGDAQEANGSCSAPNVGEEKIEGSTSGNETAMKASATSESEKDGEANGSTSSSGESEAGETDATGGLSKSEESHRGDGKAPDIALEQILKEMAEAAEQTRESARELKSNINASNASSMHTGVNEVPDLDEPLSDEELSDIDADFEEIKRKYALTDELPPDLMARGKTLRRKNERYFRSLQTPNVSYLERGSIDPSRLVGLGYGDTQIFKKNGNTKGFDGCAYVLLDNSGSMAGEKRIQASRACAVLEESFKALIPLKICAFDSGGTVYHEVIKGFDEVTRRNAAWNFCLHGRTGWGNDDGVDIMIATKELLKRPEEKKILIVLSDGAPSNRALVKKAVHAARQKRIQVCSIYFEQGEVDDYARRIMENMYEKDFVCCELSQLDENISRIMKKFSRQK